MRAAAALVLCAVLAGCAALAPEATYRNPLFGTEFADPAVMRAPDGWFYAYATQGAPAGRMLNIQVARSRDLVSWEHLGDALPVKPGWATTKQWLWAPHVIHDAARARYVMYYSAEPDASRGKCLAVAVSAHPGGPFTDSGAPLLCGQGLEHIDPMAFDDPRSGKRLLYWGSGKLPLRVQELAEDRLRFAPGSAAVELIRADEARPYRSLVEAAWVAYRDGWYYLYFSGDRCCVDNPRYAVLVARSASPLGPFEEREPAVLEASAAWLAPGHCAIVRDDAGEDWMLYHAMDRARADWVRLPMLDRIGYADGWPRVTGPTGSAQRAPRAGPTPLH
jgi:arabinan endo-1,5-alpha-L-arabinosidase